MTTKAQQASARYVRLRAEGVPRIITRDAAWHLTGGVLGTRDVHDAHVSLARIARQVPDAETFVADYRDAIQRVEQASPGADHRPPPARPPGGHEPRRTCVGCLMAVRPGRPDDHDRGCPTGQNGTPYYE